ncbi:type II toxin-antitoxin system HicB family antitoxin [Metapseudomonas otitidis]|uniref:type II toxin-antitoxin system HicB family antitoxin n=1 Tax=Metapseudomonas otitidis TaxID=319939 RepID=UPI0039FCE96D
MVNYPISVHRENDHYWSSCPDLPEAHSAGDTLEELLANAVEGIQLAMSIYVDQGREIPAASKPEPGQHVIYQPIQFAAKAALWNAMREQGLRVADLARLLEVSHPVAARLVDFEHTSKIEQLEKALGVLGKRLTVISEERSHSAA